MISRSAPAGELLDPAAGELFAPAAGELVPAGEVVLLPPLLSHADKIPVIMNKASASATIFLVFINFSFSFIAYGFGPVMP